MSVRELKRVEVLGRVKAGEVTLRQASELLAVSYRHAKRLWKRFRRRGAVGLRHGSVGRRSNRRTPAGLRRRVLALVHREFAGDARHARFGPTLAAEHLREEYGLTVHHETLRRWMLASGLWSRVRDAPKHRQRRERKAHFGELVQLDGSFEAWLEDRGPTACLMHMVDDATSRSGGRFEPQETIWGAVRTLRGWIAAYGIPLALYTDWKNVYVRKPTDTELAAGDAPLTQFGRMCAALGIRVIAASSPQAKGRVERGHGTHQDRLIKKLRRKGIGDYDAANTFLATTYFAAHNARFAQAPAAPEDFHTPVPAGLDLDQVFRLETARTVGHDWVVRHDNRLLQLERQGRHYPPARSSVLVCAYEDAHLEVWYRGRRVPWADITGTAVRGARPRPAPPRAPARGAAAARRVPSPTHPWRQRYDGLHDGVSPGERIPGRPGAWLVPPAASAGPTTKVGDPLGGLVAQHE
jgi:Homeodomain-like domain